MYIGIKEIEFEVHCQCELVDMEWEIGKAPNYGTKVYDLIFNELQNTILNIQPVYELLLFILENVHDHGSSKCIIKIGKKQRNMVIEVFEENGGFDLKKLPNGKGGWGYRFMLKREWTVSHSSDGRSTFILL